MNPVETIKEYGPIRLERWYGKLPLWFEDGWLFTVTRIPRDDIRRHDIYAQAISRNHELAVSHTFEAIDRIFMEEVIEERATNEYRKKFVKWASTSVLFGSKIMEPKTKILIGG